MAKDENMKAAKMDANEISDKLWDFLKGSGWVQDLDACNDPEEGILVTVDGRDYRIAVISELTRLKQYYSDKEIAELGFDAERQTWKKGA